MLRTIFLLTFSIVSSLLSAQQNRLDTLKQSVLDGKNDTIQVDNLLELSFGYYQIDVSLCRYYGVEAMRISEMLNDTARIALAHNCLGIASDLEGNSKQSIIHWEKCLSLSEEINFVTGRMKSLHNLGIAHKEKANFEKSLDYFLQALKIEEDRNNFVPTINTLSNIGNLYLSLNQTESAFEYIQRAIQIGEQVGIRSELSHPYQRMGEYYVLIKDYRSAMPYLRKALEICTEYGHNIRGATTLRLIGQCQFYIGSKEDAIASFERSETILLEIGEKYIDLYTLYNTWAKLYENHGELEKAFEKALTGFELAEKNSLEASKLNSLELLSRLNEKNKNYAVALKYKKDAVALKDSLDIQLKKELIIEVEAKYQIEKKEIENELLRIQQEKTEEQLSSKTVFLNTMILILVLLGVVAFLLFKAYLQKKQYNQILQSEVTDRTSKLTKSNERLIRSNLELEKFAFIASHDLKTPLRNIINFSDLLNRLLKTYPDDKAHEYLHFIKEGGVRMNSLIEDILEYSRLSEISKVQTLDKIDLNVLCQEVETSIMSYLNERNAKIEISDLLPTIKGNYSSFYILFKNLIENGIKYNDSLSPKVCISVNQVEDYCAILFNDNGVGIKQEHYEKIWGMFSRLHTQAKYEGTGLGLATCKKIVDQIGGEIVLKSIFGVGSTFELRIPKSTLINEKLAEQLISNPSVAEVC